MHLIGLLDK